MFVILEFLHVISLCCPTSTRASLGAVVISDLCIFINYSNCLSFAFEENICTMKFPHAYSVSQSDADFVREGCMANFLYIYHKDFIKGLGALCDTKLYSRHHFDRTFSQAAVVLALIRIFTVSLPLLLQRVFLCYTST
jgi:hypothetical protein